MWSAADCRLGGIKAEELQHPVALLSDGIVQSEVVKFMTDFAS